MSKGEDEGPGCHWDLHNAPTSIHCPVQHGTVPDPHPLRLPTTACHSDDMISMLTSQTGHPAIQGPPHTHTTTNPYPPPLPHDPVHSMFKILPAEGDREWHVGDELKVWIQMNDFQGLPRHQGGDFLVTRLHSPDLGAGVAGQVHDYRNGSYLAVFPLLWEGSAWVEVTLVHPMEAVAALQRLRREHPDRVFYKSLFRLGRESETTLCNVCLPTNHQPLCNFTDAHTGDPWFCYKPKRLSCDTRVDHAVGGFKKQLLTDQEKLLFQSGVNIKIHIHASGHDSIAVLPKKTFFSIQSSATKRLIKVPPSGYYLNGVWKALDGFTKHQFNDSSATTRCLKGKVIHIYGDSTVRQWFEYLNTFLPELKEFNLHSPKKIGPFMAVDSVDNILLTYRCHGPPLRYSTVPASQLRYVANELDGLAGGENTVVILSVWSHFSMFPLKYYIHRLRHIRRALLRLLNRAPGTLVVVRTPNLQALSPEVSLFNSDWYSVELHGVLRAMFQDLDVEWVDAWEMTLAHHLPHNLHPLPSIIKNMLDVALSYICPQQTKNISGH
ncbi:NXPE family member 3-like [Aplochiton taeniatus]